MAAFRLKLTGLAGSPWGRVYIISDAAMGRILDAARASYGQVPVDPQLPNGAKRDMTNEETAAAMFTFFTKGWLDQAFLNVRDIAKTTAANAVVKDTITNTTTDNT